MNKIIQKYPQSNSLKTLLMAVLVLCASQIYAGDYYVSNSWISNGVGYFSLVSYDCDQSTTIQCTQANAALPPVGHYYSNQGNYFYPNNQYYQTGYGNPVECCNAAWDHVNKGHDADCGSCNGSIIVDGNYNLTGEFNVRYTYNGQTFEEGPFTTPNDITIDHLCAGTYTHITIVGVHTGCEDVWPHDITLGEEDCCHEEGGSIALMGGGTEATICVDGVPDPLGVTMSGASATNSAWVITDEDLNILALPPAPPFDLDGAGLGTCLIWYLAFDEVHGAEVGENAGHLTGCFDLSNPITVDRRGAAWDHVNKGHDADCGSCNGSIIVDANFNLTGEFEVSYTLNGETFTEGPFMSPNDITIDHLCAGTYTDITIVGVNTGCEDVWPEDITIDEEGCCDEEGGSIVIGGSGPGANTTETTICVDGTPDPFDVMVSGASGTNFAWVITDADLNILALPPAPPFDLDGAGLGTCLVWYLAFDEVHGAEMGMNAADLSGCFDLSNPITVNRIDCCDEEGGSIVIGGSGPGANTTETTICVDGTPDPIDVVVSDASATNSAWVITDSDLNILALPDAPPFDLDGAGVGTCLIWYLAYDEIQGAMVNANAADLEGCFDLSNPITVNRIDCCDEEGGSIVIGGSGPDANTTATSICVDGTPDPIDVVVSDASATNSAWVITDSDLNILALPPAPPFDLDGAGEGVCLIWYVAYETIEGVMMGANAADLTGCFDLSNPITVTRTCCDDNGMPVDCMDMCDEDGGMISIPPMGGSGPGTDAISICVDGVPDPFDVQVMGASGTSFAWVITDADLNILALPPAPPFDLDGAGEGVCLVWYVAFDEIMGAEVGANAANLSGCFDLSNPITVTRTCCDADGNPVECQAECQEYTLDFNDPHTNWHPYSTSDSYTVGNQTFDIHIEDDDHILQYTNESNAGISVGINPHDRHDEVVITYELSEVASSVVFDIVDLDYKTGGSKQQEKVCVYGLLGNDDMRIMPTIESLDGSVAIDGNCATATTNSSVSGQDESILVTFDECIDQIVIVYGSGPDAPHNPDYSKIYIGKDSGFSTDVCPGECTEAPSCQDYTLDFEDNSVSWHHGATSDEYDLGGQDVSINIEDNDHILELTREDDSGLQVGIEPHDRHDEVVIMYTLSEVSSHVLFDIVDLDYKTGGSKQQEKVCVYGLLGDDDTEIMPNITSLDGSVDINGNCATATTNSSLGHDESVLVEFTECIDQVVIVYGSGPDAPHNPSYAKITIGEDYGFTAEVCPDPCQSSGSREDESFVADVSIFPNPVSESFVTLSIESELQGAANIVLIDALGRTINNLPIALNGSLTQYQLNISDLSSGVYFVTVVTQEGRSKAQQLVVVRP